MDKRIITFEANQQCLRKTGGLDIYASKTVSYIEAHFDLGENWSGFDSVEAVWWNDYVRPVRTVLDTEGVCVVPTEVLLRKSVVYVNLVGVIASGNTLTDRLTTVPITALTVKFNAQLGEGTTTPITPSEYQQFVATVKADADRAGDAKDSARAYAGNALSSAQNALVSETNASTSETNAHTSEVNAKASELNAETYKDQAQTYAQNADISATNAENAKDEAESARDEILGMRAEATTLEPNESATASYSDGVLTLGIPKGDKGDKGNTGDTGASAGFGTVSATVDDTIGTPSVEVTASGADTAKNFAFAFHNLKGEKGDKGDPGDVSQAQLDAAVSDLKSDITEINTILENTSGTEAKTGSQLTITDAVVGGDLTSTSGSGLINNGNILPSTLISKTYLNPDATTESMTSNKWGFAIVSASDLNSILKEGKKYTLSYDFELVEVRNATVANKEYGLMMRGGAIIPPYKSTAENHHDGFKFSVSQEFTVPSGGFTASLNFYNGGNYNDDICTLTNMVISCEGVTVAWREANNVVLGDESTVTIPYNPMYIDSDDDTVSVEYMGKSTTNRLDEMESVSSGIIAEMSEMKIATNPHIKNVCHRGLASVAPEDTAPAYVAAKIAGFEYVENDLWFTSDGVPVMVHARDLSLVSDGTGNIDEVTYSYFKSLDFGQATVYGDKYTGLEGLSFEEFVILCKTLGLYMYLDCKSFSPYPEGYNNGIEVCLEILEKHSFTKNVTWIVGLSGVASVRNLIPDARVAYIISNTPDASDIEDLSSYILADDPDATLFDVNDSYITTQSVIDVHNAGLKIEAWRSEIPPTESAILETALKGIDGYTNDGANLNKIITDYYEDLYGID